MSAASRRDGRNFTQYQYSQNKIMILAIAMCGVFCDIDFAFAAHGEGANLTGTVN
jgi:hypothetical protein